jgi:hypothetical protein
MNQDKIEQEHIRIRTWLKNRKCMACGNTMFQSKRKIKDQTIWFWNCNNCPLTMEVHHYEKTRDDFMRFEPDSEVNDKQITDAYKGDKPLNV